MQVVHPPREPTSSLRLLRGDRRDRSPRRQQLPDKVPLRCLPAVGDGPMDNDFVYWPSTLVASRPFPGSLSSMWCRGVIGTL